MNDFLQHWNLLRKPFEATWDTRFYFRSPQHSEALERLFYLVHERTMNLGMLTGEIGCGKTLTAALLSQALDPAEYLVAVCENSGFSLNDLLGAVLAKIDPAAALVQDNTFARCERLRAVAEAAANEGRHVIILLDEAQDMVPDTLRQLAWLTNFNGNGRPLLSLILMGQPDLREKVQAAPSICQRIGLHFHLTPLCADSSVGYLEHRLRAAGHEDGQLFTADAAAMLHLFSQGVPREINRLAKLAMEHAWALNLATVSDVVLHEVLCDNYRQYHIHSFLPASS